MSNIQALSLLTYFDETTQGTPPADAAAWIASGVRLHHISETLDMSGVEVAQVEDMRNQSRVFATEARVVGIDNPEFPFSVYSHGTGATTADGAQVATSAGGYQLGYLLGHALGGVSRGYSTVVDGGSSTATVVDVDDASNYEEGEFVAIELGASLPSNYPSGTAFPRRIMATDAVSTPNTITLDQALPAAPAAAAAVHGTIVSYIDEDILCDSAAGPYTRSWLVQKGMPGSSSDRREAWVFRGTVATLQSISLGRGETSQLGFQVMAGSHASPTGAAWPTAWSANAELGLAPFSVGPLCEVWLEDEGTTTNTTVQVSSFEVEPSVPRVRVETLTSTGTNMNSTYGYAVEPAETTISMRIDPFSVAQWTDQEAGTLKSLRWAKLAPAGSGFAISFPKVSHIATPKRGINNATAGVEVSFKAHEDDDLATMPTLANRWRSKFCIVQW